MGSAELQGKLWGPGARDWAELNEPACTPFYEAVFDAIGVRPGMTLLDAGCGGGFALQLAAKRGATVTGFDACAPLLDIARERVPAADIRQGDLESLPFAGHTFDAITAFNSVQFAADPAAALRELRRVAKPGAPVAIVTWGRPSDARAGSSSAPSAACCRHPRQVRKGRSRSACPASWKSSPRPPG